MKNLNNLSIKSWSEDDRPREKLLNKGRASLSNSELIAILIGSGSKEESAVDLAKKILSDANDNLNSLGQKSIHDLMQFKGVGEAKAISIVSALELGRRRQATPQKKTRSISSSRAAFDFINLYLSDLPHEEFLLLTLNRSNKPIKVHNISKGGVSQTVVDIKILLKYVINDLASGIIVAHNHPSGNLMPSASDKNLTKKIKQACKILDVTLLDHLIVSDKNYYSFVDEGIL